MRQYTRIFVCDADNVSSKQFQEIRKGMRGYGDVLMGKNTMLKRAIRDIINEVPELERLLPLIKGNVGFVMTNGDLKEIRDLIETFTVPAAARSGAIAPVEVVVPPQNTGLGPEKTSFFQALSIPTKITYGLDILNIYDNGTVFDPAILDITDDDIRGRFMSGVNNIAAVSLAIGYPTVASVPHSIANSFKNLAAIAAATDIAFPQVDALKAFLADPSAFVVAAAPAGGDGGAATGGAEEKADSDSSDDMGAGGLFSDDSDDGGMFGMFD